MEGQEIEEGNILEIESSQNCFSPSPTSSLPAPRIERSPCTINGKLGTSLPSFLFRPQPIFPPRWRCSQLSSSFFFFLLFLRVCVCHEVDENCDAVSKLKVFYHRALLQSRRSQTWNGLFPSAKSSDWLIASTSPDGTTRGFFDARPPLSCPSSPPFDTWAAPPSFAGNIQSQNGKKGTHKRQVRCFVQVGCAVAIHSADTAIEFIGWYIPRAPISQS